MLQSAVAVRSLVGNLVSLNRLRSFNSNADSIHALRRDVNCISGNKLFCRGHFSLRTVVELGSNGLYRPALINKVRSQIGVLDCYIMRVNVAVIVHLDLICQRAAGCKGLHVAVNILVDAKIYLSAVKFLGNISNICLQSIDDLAAVKALLYCTGKRDLLFILRVGVAVICRVELYSSRKKRRRFCIPFDVVLAGIVKNVLISYLLGFASPVIKGKNISYLPAVFVKPALGRIIIYITCLTQSDSCRFLANGCRCICAVARIVLVVNVVYKRGRITACHCAAQIGFDLERLRFVYIERDLLLGKTIFKGNSCAWIFHQRHRAGGSSVVLNSDRVFDRL